MRLPAWRLAGVGDRGIEATIDPSESEFAEIQEDKREVGTVERGEERETRAADATEGGEPHPSVARDAFVAARCLHGRVEHTYDGDAVDRVDPKRSAARLTFLALMTPARITTVVSSGGCSERNGRGRDIRRTLRPPPKPP